MKSTLKNQRGQTTIEFAMTLLFILAFSLFYFQLTLFMGVGNYIHYATFMSARAYLSAGSTDDQVSRAHTVLQKMLQINDGRGAFSTVQRGLASQSCVGDSTLQGSCIGDGPNNPAVGDRASSWMRGVRYRFKGRLFVLPFAGATGTDETTSSLILQSESWLGREPKDADCAKDLQQKGGYVDNGC